MKLGNILGKEKVNFVSILMGSKSDFEIVNHCAKTLEKFGVPYEMIVSSAHRTPERTHKYIQKAEKKGAKVFICAAGMAAHLGGVVASLTTKPVLGIPLKGGTMEGLDSLLSTVQMPSSMPVGTLAIGKAGAINAAYLAVQIMAINDEELAKKLQKDREENISIVEEASREVEVLLD